MDHRPTALYLGFDHLFAGVLESKLADRGFDLSFLDPGSFATAVEDKSLKLGISSAESSQSTSCEEAAQLLAQRHWLAILDFDFEPKAMLDVMHAICQRNVGVNLIGLSSETTRATLSVAYSNSFEAFFFKPLENFDELLDRVDAVHMKMQAWQESFRKLGRAALAEETLC